MAGLVISSTILDEVRGYVLSIFLDDCSRCVFSSNLRRLTSCRTDLCSLMSDDAVSNFPETFSDFTISVPEVVTVTVELLMEDSTVVVVRVVLMERCEAGVALKVQVVGLFTFGGRRNVVSWCGLDLGCWL